MEHSLMPTFTQLAMGEKDLTPKSDLTYKMICGITLKGVDVTQSLLTGTLLRNLVVDNSIFESCDLEGTRIECCGFTHASFTSADIRSSEFVQTNFSHCSFDDAFIKNCTFTNCKFEHCTFDTSAFTESILNNCTLTAVSFKGSTNMLNSFRECDFEDVVLGNCTFLLHICRNCSFKRAVFNLDSVGLLFGVDEESIKNNRFLFLGQEEDADPDSIKINIIKEYERRKWILQVGVAKLNFGLISPLEFCIFINQFIRLSINNGVIVKQEDVLFLTNIITELYESDRLPYFGLLELLDGVSWLNEETLKNSTQNTASIQALVNSVYLNLFKLQKRMTQLLPSLPTESLAASISVEITFDVALRNDICRLFDTAAYAFGGLRAHSELIEIRQGSVTYVIRSIVAAVFGLQITLWGINGCLIQFTEVLARVSALQGELPNAYQEIAKRPEHPIPQDIQKVMEITFKTIGESGFLDNNLYEDLGPGNFISIDKGQFPRNPSQATQSHK